MRDKVIKQLFLKFEKDLHKQSISQVTELYYKFNETCKDFRKKLIKIAGKEQSPEISKKIDKAVEAYTDCFFELAYAYYDKGYFNGLISALRNRESE